MKIAQNAYLDLYIGILIVVLNYLIQSIYGRIINKEIFKPFKSQDCIMSKPPNHLSMQSKSSV
jgi:hypothetical protein